MTQSDGRASRSAVTTFRESRSFVVMSDDEKRVARHPSCTPERLRP